MTRLRIILVLSITIIVALISGCHYHNINGDLDGQWQLTSIIGEDNKERHVGGVYYAIQMHTGNLRSLYGEKTTGNLRYQKEASSLTIEFPLQADLSQWGLPNSPCKVTFTIVELSTEYLIMNVDSNGNRLVRRKF